MKYEYARSVVTVGLNLADEKQWKNDDEMAGKTVYDRMNEIGGMGYRVTTRTIETAITDSYILRTTEITGEREVTT